jgi:hypothetical protein
MEQALPGKMRFVLEGYRSPIGPSCRIGPFRLAPRCRDAVPRALARCGTVNTTALSHLWLCRTFAGDGLVTFCQMGHGPLRGRAGQGPQDALPGPGLPEADLPRAGPGCPGPLPAAHPAVPVQQLLREIRELGYQASSNLLVRYLTQGRAEADRPHLSPRRAARLLLTRPATLTAGQHETIAGLGSSCPEMAALAGLIGSFAALLTPDPGSDGLLRQWITAARAADLPLLHAFTNGLDLDIQAATAALTVPHQDFKMIKRQMYGRVKPDLLRERVLLAA